MNVIEALELASLVAIGSGCDKSKRGVVVFHRDIPTALGVGHNHPPAPMRCDGSDLCRAECNKICVHAEQAAILDVCRADGIREGSQLLHIKVMPFPWPNEPPWFIWRNGPIYLPVPSGPPSCWQCSRFVLEAGIAKVWLAHAPATSPPDVGNTSSEKNRKARVAWLANGLRCYTALEFHRLTLEHHQLPITTE